MNNSTKILGIDIGGTSIKTSIVDIDNGCLKGETVRIKTPRPASVSSIIEIFDKLKEKFKWEGPVGCGFPGVVKNGRIQTAANLSKKWINVNLLEHLESIFLSKITVINDADAAAIAEMQFGSGQRWNAHNRGVVLIVTLGTGIGTALFVDGHLVPNTEFGHNDKFQNDPHFKDYIVFYEYFNGNTGFGLGASHQTGWTGLIAKLIQPSVKS